MNTESDLLDRIDEITAAVCAHCNGPLGDSPSDDFCSQDCQQAWTVHRQEVAELVGYREPWERPHDFPGIGYDSARWADGQAWTPAAAQFDWAAMRNQLDRAPRTQVVSIGADGRWTTRISPDEAQRLLNEFNAAIRPAIASVSEAFRSVSASLAPVVQHLQRTGAIPPTKPDSPMQAALEARRNRNTGPRVHADARLNRRG